MDFIDNLRSLAAKIANTRSMIQTEEATKNAMVMPLIRLLGYDVFDPQEVTPELVADVGMKKGEKVDYAILKDGDPIMLFECKKAGAELNISHASQLFRYFHVIIPRMGIPPAAGLPAGTGCRFSPPRFPHRSAREWAARQCAG